MPPPRGGFGVSEAKCLKCDLTIEETGLRRCVICHKHFCEDHAYRMSGNVFCSKGCAHYFFFSDPDD